MSKSDAQVELEAAKALCRATCGAADAAVSVIEPEALVKAVAAHHVITSPDDPVGVALAGGRMVDHSHLAAVNAVVQAVVAGQDPVTASGADKAHVDALVVAASVHEPHRARLEAAYAAFAAGED